MSGEKKDTSANPSGDLIQPDVGHLELVSTQFGQRIWDSFKRDPNSCIKQSYEGHNGADIESATYNTSVSPLQRRLKTRHVQMIAIGGSIGTGLFVGSGSILAAGGPASVLIAYCLIGCMLFFTMQALGEMAVAFPVAGSFAHYATRFIDPAWGFAMGWIYAFSWMVTLPLEIVAASITIDYWSPGVSNAAWVAIFWVLIVGINFFGVRGYGESEFVLSIIKIIAVIGFIILGIILNCGGGPQGEYIGGKYWQDPGAFNNGFKGLCNVFVTAAFAFSGTELVGLAAAETENPRKSLPAAIKQVFWRILIFYVVSLLIVGLLVPYTDEKLVTGSSSADAHASPFVIAIENAGILGLPSVVNVVILIAVLSVGNSSVYGASRTLSALADQGQAPRFLGYIDRKGRPLFAVCVTSAFGLLCFLAVTDKQTEVFEWLMAIAGLAEIFIWASICLCHIRFRQAWKVQGRTLSELAFCSQTGVVGSWLGFGFNCLVLVAQFWTAAWPSGYGNMSPSYRASTFFSYYLAAPVTIFLYAAYKVWFRTRIVRSCEVDLTVGRRVFDVDQMIEQEMAEQRNRPFWKKLFKIFC
ncbi:hypothetical protein N7462_002138 [Penicillium macrosclerotiorum]|uniref:uncharacterized protein n=1 Tax=Penicillium macrosclerotiorum TaxID=303699 RepID=UPI00254728DE|nr:uncharacterized protein N7462_002138 [Penicillium macrosclerotiorum]KAJ5692715.1 hypothetical protein N7462_002138 [Penicillium macrosclerotiorum]